MTDAQTCVLALEPDEAFARQVLAYKERVRRAVGDQLYLDHPPHLTLYLAVFAPGSDLVSRVSDVCRRLPVATVTMRGWHVFEADQLTGKQTLVCDVTPETRDALCDVQQETVAVAAPLRDRHATRACYDKSWDRLSAEERANVESLGFPFVGPIWRPHVTVASVDLEAWEEVWEALAAAPPEEVVRFTHLSIYGLEDEQPVLVERLELEGTG